MIQEKGLGWVDTLEESNKEPKLNLTTTMKMTNHDIYQSGQFLVMKSSGRIRRWGRTGGAREYN